MTSTRLNILIASTFTFFASAAVQAEPDRDLKEGRGPLQPAVIENAPRVTVPTGPGSVVERRPRTPRHSHGFHYGTGGYYPWAYDSRWGTSWQNLYPGNTVFVPTPYWYGPNQYPVGEIPRRIDPNSGAYPAAVPQAPAPVAAAPVDEGREAFRFRDYERAAAVYARRTREQAEAEAAATTTPPPDRSAQRLMGYALAGAGRLEGADQVFRDAYTQDSTLALNPIPGIELVGSVQAREIVLNAVQYAQRTNTPDAWIMVSILMEAEGRPQVARKMRERAASLQAPPTSPPEPAPGPASYRMPADQP